MKKIKTIAFILLLVLLAACSAAPEAEYIPDYSSFEDETIDLEGAEFYFAPWRVDLYFPTLGNTAAGDKMLERYTALQEEYNCKFTYINTDSAPYDSSVITMRFVSGQPVPDIIDREVNCAYSLYKAGYLASMDEISTINSSDSKWGPYYFRAQSMFDGTPYGFCPYEWEWMPEIHGTILTNNLLISRMSLQSPYEIIENGEWTWAKMSEQLSAGTYTDGEISYTGMVVYKDGVIPVDMMQAAAFSNGAQMLIEKGGNVVFGFTAPEAIEAFTYVAQLFADKTAKIGTKTDFINDGCPYYFSRSYESTAIEADSIGALMEDYGFIPFPQGPSSTGKTGAYVAYDRLLYIVRMTENEIDAIGTVIDYLFEPLDDEGGWKNRARIIFHHSEDIEFYIDAIENPSYNYEIQLGSQYAAFQTAAQSVIDGKATAAEAMSSIEAAINAQAETENIQLIPVE